MIVLRIVFAAVLMGLSVLIGRAQASKLDCRAKALGDFMAFIRQLEVLIRVNGRTIPDALQECSRRFAGKWTGRFAQTLEELYGSRTQSSGIWLSALNVMAKESEEASALSREDREIIGLFGDQLTSADMKSIAENYAFLYGRIGENLQASDRDKAVKGRLYNTIGLLAGLAAAIVVI